MKDEPARLKKKEEIVFDSWMLLHPAVIIITMLLTVALCSALVFALTGGSAVESGGMRNFLINGV